MVVVLAASTVSERFASSSGFIEPILGVTSATRTGLHRLGAYSGKVTVRRLLIVVANIYRLIFAHTTLLALASANEVVVVRIATAVAKSGAATGRGIEIPARVLRLARTGLGLLQTGARQSATDGRNGSSRHFFRIVGIVQQRRLNVAEAFGFRQNGTIAGAGVDALIDRRETIVIAAAARVGEIDARLGAGIVAPALVLSEAVAAVGGLIAGPKLSIRRQLLTIVR